MADLDLEKIKQFRNRTYRINSSSRLRSRDDAIQFVNERGFVFFWPNKGLVLPSLWVAAAGDRPVADEHDDPGHITWGWKDELLGSGLWYYGRVLGKRNCMISLRVLPFFYALSPNYGEPENDYLEDYRKGILSLEAKNVFETLLREGPLDSIALRRATHLTGAGTDSRFNKALEVLQTSFRVIPTGTSKNGPWHYAFIYDLFHRHFPEQINQSRTISEDKAREKLVYVYLNSVGACGVKDLNKLFHWDQEHLMIAIESLVKSNLINKNNILSPDKQSIIYLNGLL